MGCQKNLSPNGAEADRSTEFLIQRSYTLFEKTDMPLQILAHDIRCDREPASFQVEHLVHVLPSGA